MAKCNISKGISSLEERIKKEEEELERLINKDNLENRDVVLSEKIDRIKKLRDELLILLIENKKHPNGIIISGAIVSKLGNKAWYMYGASDNIYRDLMPNYLLQWHMIKWAKKIGL